jgi:hypothetical protein
MEASLDKIESLLAKEYKEKKGYYHDHCYFEVTEKYQSAFDESLFEVCLIMARVDHEATTKSNTKNVIWYVQNSFDCGFVFRATSDIELKHKVERWIVDRIDYLELQQEQENEENKLETNKTNEDEKQGTTEAN